MPDFLETTIDKFIFKVATDRLYGPAGIWVLEDAGAGHVRLGVTDYQQQLNGDVAFVHLKPTGTSLNLGDEFAEVETIKATVSFQSPVAGKVVEINEALDLAPETVNQAPYGQGWLMVIETTDWQADRARLLAADAYLSAMRSQAEEELKK
ncbi:MAG: glycine cleavage system protein H [Thermoguttaceae bacterium]